MSGTLGDVFMFRSNGGFPGVAEDSSGGMAIEEKDGGLSSRQRKDSSNALGNTNIEWQQLLKDGVNANAGNRSMFGDSESSSFPALNQQKFHFMGSLGGAGSGGGPWDCPRAASTAVNYLQAFGPVSSGSNGGVDGQLGEIRLAVDGQQQMLTDVLRRPSSSCEVPAEGPGGVKEEKEFDSSSTISSHILQGGTITTSGQQQQLFATSHPLMPSPASMQQLNRSPNHAIRNLFPEKSSSFSSGMLQSHEDLGASKIDEQALLQLSKKPRMQEYGDGGGPVSSPVSLSEVDNANRLAHGGSSGQYRKSPFAHNQRTNALGNLIDCSSSYSEPSPTSFSSAFPPADRSASFSAANMPSLQAIGLSNFRSAGCPLLAMKNSTNESMAMKSPNFDYGRYALDPSNRIQSGGDYRGELLGSDRDPSSFLGVSSPQPGVNFMPLVGSMGSGPFNFPCRRQSTLDTGGRGAWPAGLISNIPSLSMETPSRPLLPSKRTLHDREQPEGLLEEREARRVHPGTESRRRMLIQKQLTTTDVGSLGRIILPKKEAETHLPHLPDKEGIEMYMYDYEADRTWTMKYRFWPNNKSRMYLLENTGEFAKFHALQQGDWLFIYRESSARYVLRAKKSAPLLQVTPSSQSVTEVSAAASAGPAAAPAEDVGGPASASGSRPTNQSPSPVSTTDGGSGTPSSSKETVCGGTPSAPSNQHSLDVPSSRFSASSTGAKSPAPAPVVVEAKKPTAPPRHHPHDQLPSSTLNSPNKHLVLHLQQAVRASAPSRTTAADDAHHHKQPHQELRIKNYMPVQQQQQQSEHDMPSELDGGGEFNLEDFPRLIEADDETIDNILGHSDSHVTVDGRPRTVSLEGRGDEEASSSSRRSI